MANQAIALQARAPQQGNFLAPAIQQGAQMVNMMRQQQALDRQTAVAQQQMEIQRAGETRAAAGEDRAAAKFKLDQDAMVYAKHRQYAPAVIQGGAAVYQQWLDGVAQDNPQAAQMFASAMPVENFDKDAFTRMVGTMDQNFEARYGKAITKELITPEGGVMGANISGLPGATYAVPVPDISRPLTPAAPAAGVQPMAAPQASAPAGGGMFRPISAPGGQPQGADPQAALLASLTEAKQTGQIGADVVEQLYQMAGPQNTAAVDQFLQTNRIQVAGDGMRSAVYRPEGNAMAAQQVQYDPNAYAPVRVKSPMASPLPGSASVPLDRVAAEARAGRQTPQEAYAIKLAEAQAARDIGPKPLTGPQEAKLRASIAKDYSTTQSTIDAMLNPVSGVVAAAEAVRNLSPEQKEAVTGFSGYVPSVTDSSKTADIKLGNLIGKVTELGKAQSSLSGAIGPMAVQEWKIVRDMIADLNVKGMGASDLDNQIDIIVSAAQGAAQRVRDKYEDQYAEDFDRYPNRFRLKDPQAAAKPAAGAGKIPRYNPATRSFE